MAFDLKKRFKKTYIAFVKCENCGFNSEVKVTKGVSVSDFVRQGKCICDSCGVVSFPEEYTTDHFEKEKKVKLNLKFNGVKK